MVHNGCYIQFVCLSGKQRVDLYLAAERGAGGYMNQTRTGICAMPLENLCECSPDERR